jgi:hypothetical protein
VSSSPDFAFLIIFTRTWELALGALVALGADTLWDQRLRKHGHILSILGLLMVCGSYLLFNSLTPHPSLWTLIPVIGTGLILQGSTSENISGRFLSMRPLVFVGLISYSLYLWHQPMLAFVRLLSLEEPTHLQLFFVALASAVPAYLSFRFIEKPFRDAKRITRTLLFSVCGGFAILLLGAGLYLHSISGWIGTLPTWASADWGQNAHAMYNESARQFALDEFPEQTTHHRLLIIGESYARDFINAGAENGYFDRYDLKYNSNYFPCDEEAPSELSSLLSQDDYVVFVYYEAGFNARCIAEKYAEYRQKTPAKIVVVGTKGFGWSNTAVMRLPITERYVYRAQIQAHIQHENDDAKKVLGDSVFVDLLAMLQDSTGRVAVLTPEKKLISLDRRHLTKSGAKHIGKVLFTHPRLKDFQQKVGTDN